MIGKLTTLRSGRQCEFGRAALMRMMDGSRASPHLYYVGCMRPEHSDVKIAMEEMVYNEWDRSPSAPPKTRPVEPQAEPNLVLLNWCNNMPSFPDMILQKFPESSASYLEMLELKKMLVDEFGEAPSRSSSVTTSRNTVRRAVGRPDFTIEDGLQPLDVTRALTLDFVPVTTFNAERTKIGMIFFMSCLVCFYLVIVHVQC